MIKITALLLAVLLSVAIIPTASLTAQAQNETSDIANATSTTNTTTTETNTTIPISPEIEAPEAIGNQTGNQSESPDNATKADGLLGDAQVKIDEARKLILSLQALLDQAGTQSNATGNKTEQIVDSANESAEEIVDIVEEEITNDTEVVDNIENATEEIVNVVNDSIDSNENATIEDIENVTDTVVEVIDNATEDIDNSTTEVAVDNALIRLLTNLVSAQDYNQNFAQEQRDELRSNLQDAIAELADDAADALRD